MQCAETKAMLKKIISHHIAFLSYGLSKGKKKEQKFKFSSKVAEFPGKIVIDLTIIFRNNDFFCVIISF